MRWFRGVVWSAVVVIGLSSAAGLLHRDHGLATQLDSYECVVDHSTRAEVGAAETQSSTLSAVGSQHQHACVGCHLKRTNSWASRLVTVDSGATQTADGSAPSAGRPRTGVRLSFDARGPPLC